MWKSRRISLCISIVVAVGIPATAFPNPTVQEGLYESNTFTLAYDPENSNGDLVLLIPPPVGFFEEDPDADNRMVDDHLDLVGLGYTVASVDCTNHKGLRLAERPQELREFAIYVQEIRDLNGSTFVTGAPGTGAFVHLLLQFYPGMFRGGVAIGGPTNLPNQLKYLHYSFNEQFWTFRNPTSVFQSIFNVQDLLEGAARDRETLLANPNLTLLSPTSGVGSIMDREIVVHGDSDLSYPIFNLWEYTDAMISAGKGDHLISFSVPAGGEFAPGIDVPNYYGDLLMECIEWSTSGTPPQYQPGTTYGPRDVSDENVPSASDASRLDVVLPVIHPVLISLQNWTGQGSYLGGLNGAVRLIDLDGNGVHNILFGDAEGFVHIMEMMDGTLAELWRSSDLGTLAFALDAAPIGDSELPKIAVGNSEGQIRILSGAPPYTMELIYQDPLAEPILDLFLERLVPEGPTTLLARTFDGYVIAIDPISHAVVARSPYLGPTPGTGMDVGDLDGDGTTEIVVGTGTGVIQLLSGSDLGIVAESASVGFHPWRVHFANVLGSPSKEVIVNGNPSEWGAPEATTVILDTQLTEIKRTENLTGYQGFVALDRDGGHRDDLLLGSMGQVTTVDLPSRTRRQWSLSNPDELVTGLACEDLDGDGQLDLVAVTREGSIEIVDLDSFQRKARRVGLAGAYGCAVTEINGSPNPEIAVGVLPSGVRFLDGVSLEPAGFLPLPMEWAHAVRSANVDFDPEKELIIGTGNGVETRPEDLRGFIHALDSDGSVNWTTRDEKSPFDNANGSRFGIELFDFNLDQKPEVVTATDVTADHSEEGSAVGTASVSVFDGATGELIRSGSLEGHDAYGISVGDATGNGSPEVVVGDRRGFLHILSATGRSTDLTEIHTSQDLGSGIVAVEVANLDRIGAPEIVCGLEEGSIKIVRFNGEKLQVVAESADLGSHVWGILVHDLDNDDELEIVAGNANGDLFVFTAQLTLLYSRSGLGAFTGAYGGLAVSDIDGDSYNELIVGSSGYLYCFDVRNSLHAGGAIPPPAGPDPTAISHNPPPLPGEK